MLQQFETPCWPATLPSWNHCWAKYPGGTAGRNHHLVGSRFESCGPARQRGSRGKGDSLCSPAIIREILFSSYVKHCIKLLFCQI